VRRTTESQKGPLSQASRWLALAFFLGLVVAWTAAPATSAVRASPAQSPPFPSPAAVIDTAVTAALVSPRSGTVGTLVNIQATVQNLGDANETVQVNATAGSRLVGTNTVSLTANNTVNGSRSVSFNWDTSTDGAGSYPITIEATPLPGETNLSDNIFHAGSVELVAPGAIVVEVTANPPASDVTKTIIFLCQASGGVRPYRYLWDFGDGRQDTKALSNKSYIAPGVKTVKCTVTDNASSQASASLIVVIAPIPVVFAMVDRTSASPLTTLNFRAWASGGTGDIRYTWAFGDGKTSTASRIDHVYDNPGQYPVTVVARDSVDGTDSASLIVTIASLKVTAIQSATSINEDDTVTFGAFATGGSGGPYTYLWKFGDGLTWTEPTARHVYSLAGKYTPSVEVTDGFGTTATQILDQIVVAGGGLAPSTGPPYFEAGLGLAAVVAVAVGTTFAVRRERRRRRWGPRPR
jgi:PKD repeat protein